MNAKDTIKTGLQQSQEWLQALLADIHETATTFPTPNGGNHPLWIYGHLIHSEAAVVSLFILGEENPLAKWDSVFGAKATPVADASAYPSVEELKAAFETTRAKTLQVLEGLSEADLDKRSHAPEEYASMFGTIGKCFVITSLHASFHAGQVADARRAAGKSPVFG